MLLVPDLRGTTKNCWFGCTNVRKMMVGCCSSAARDHLPLPLHLTLTRISFTTKKRSIYNQKAMSLAQASVSDKEAVKNVLQDPLTGRKIMIPFTSKAFFEGSLQPTISSDNKEEQVLVKLSKETLVEMSRSEAITLLEKRILAVQKKVHKVLTKKPATKQKLKQEPVGGPALGFFEIREEYDDSGKEIRAEAINVAKELEYLQKHEEEKVDFDVPTPTELDDNMLIDENQPVVSDQDYESISSRLELLSRLEEEADANKNVNQTSSKKIQGSGWGKGFLNKPRKTKQTPKVEPKPSTTTNPSTTVEERAPRTRKVGFGENKIREIPRIGEHSVPKAAPAKAPTRLISQSVFSGVVAERPVGGVVQERNAASEQPKKKLSRFAQQRLEQQQQIR